jgi:CDP-diacylglycerol--serine O-phosphatidyltransferase
MKLKDYVTLGNILGGLASMVAAFKGSLEWACYFMIIAWIFDSFDGAVARLTGGGNKFGEVFDNVADLVAYSLAPSFMIFLVYHTPRDFGGAGWPVWAAAGLAFVPTVFGTIRFTRNNVKDIILPEFHIGLPRTVYALYIATLFTCHIFQNPWVFDPESAVGPVLYTLAAIFIVATSILIMTLRPYFAKPKRGASRWVVFCTYWFLITCGLGFVAGLVFSDMKIFLDTMFVNFTLYTWFQHMTIPAHKRREIAGYVDRLIAEWKEEMG